MKTKKKSVIFKAEDWSGLLIGAARPSVAAARIVTLPVVPVDAASFILLQEQLESVLHTLHEREKKVIQLRFGLQDGHPRTRKEVGKELGVTRERIRQIESKTHSKLRHPSRSQKLRDYLE